MGTCICAQVIMYQYELMNTGTIQPVILLILYLEKLQKLKYCHKKLSLKNRNSLKL